jgi:hypothetical protein
MASFALEIVNMRTAGTCQGFAMPRPAGAPLTEPVRPRERFLIRGRRKQIEVSYNPGTVIGSGSFEGGRPDATISRATSTWRIPAKCSAGRNWNGTNGA